MGCLANCIKDFLFVCMFVCLFVLINWSLGHKPTCPTGPQAKLPFYRSAKLPTPTLFASKNVQQHVFIANLLNILNVRQQNCDRAHIITFFLQLPHCTYCLQNDSQIIMNRTCCQCISMSIGVKKEIRI